MTPFQTIAARVPHSAPQAVRENIDIVGRLAERFQNEAAAIRRDGSLTPRGHAEKIRAKLGGGIGAHFKQLRSAADNAITEIEREIAGMRKRAIELVGDGYSPELRREVRSFLRALDSNERRQLAFKTEDRLIQSAILEVPAFLSGLEPQAYNAIEQRVVETAFGDRLAKLEPEHRAWQEAAAALTVARNQMAREAELEPAAFEMCLAA